MNKRLIIVTGNKGYLGPLVVKGLRDRNYVVVGVDIDLYQEYIPFAYLPDYQVTHANQILSIFDQPRAVVHLAAISNDPMGELHPKLTYDTNVGVAAEMASLFPDAHHILASSASVYGINPDTCVEDTPVNPLTVYADSKIKAERILESISGTAAFLRFGTLWGDAPNFRVDLAVNHFAVEAETNKKIEPLSNARRPIVHVQDAADAIIRAVDGGPAMFHGIYNVASENVQMFGVAEKMAAEYNVAVSADESLANADRRSYYVGTLRDPHLVSGSPRKVSDPELLQRLLACAGKNRGKMSRIAELKLSLDSMGQEE